MNSQKLSISLSQQQFDFIENYQTEHHLNSRSDVIKQALRLLEQTQLEACYQEASKEVNEDFDVSISEGLDEDETW